MPSDSTNRYQTARDMGTRAQRADTPLSRIAERQRELEAELAAARKAARPGKPDRKQWHTPPVATQEDEGWFTTYLDVMTLLLVLLVVMLAYSGKHIAGGLKPPSDALPAISLAPGMVGLPDASLSPILASIGLLPGSNGLLPQIGLHHQYQYQAAPQRATPTANQRPPEGTLVQLGQDFTESEPSTTDTALTEEIALAQRNTFAKGEPLVENGSLTGTDALTQPSGAAPKESLAQAEEPLATIEEAPAISPQETNRSQETLPASVETAAAPVPAPAAAPEPPPKTPAKEDMLAGLPLGELGDDIDIIVNERSVSFRINSEILFGSGQAELSPKGLAVLKRLIPVFNSVKHRITVEGHTDSVPMLRNRQYPSNWELSGARASSVVRYLQANGIASDRLRAIGNADTQPLASNSTPEGRANNRRVELIMERPEN